MTMKLFKASVVYIIILIFYGCTDYDNYIYEVTQLQTSNADNSAEMPVDVLSDSVPAKAYAVKLQYTMVLKGSTGDKLDTHESSYINEDHIQTFNIFSLSDFDSVHDAGISLNDYFLFSPGGTINNKITNGNVGAGRSQGNDATTWTSNEYLMLMVSPPVSGSYQFVIDIGMNDGRHLVDTTSVILY